MASPYRADVVAQDLLGSIQETRIQGLEVPLEVGVESFGLRGGELTRFFEHDVEPV